MPEIDEAELRRYHTLAQTVNTILANPKAKLLVQEAHKLVNPNAVTPEFDQRNLVAEPVAAIRKEFEDFKAETAKEKAAREKDERLTALRATEENGIARLRREGWNDEGITAVKKLMEEKGLLDPLDAAAIFEKQHPPQMPVTPAGGVGAWNFTDVPAEGGDDIKKLLDTRGSESVADNMARVALNEMRQSARR